MIVNGAVPQAHWSRRAGIKGAPDCNQQMEALRCLQVGQKRSRIMDKTDLQFGDKHLTPIPMPWSQRWREFRLRCLPVLIFTCAVIGVAILWPREMPAGGAKLLNGGPPSKHTLNGLLLGKQSTNQLLLRSGFVFHPSSDESHP